MTVVLQINLTGRPKGFILDRAFEFCGLSGFEIDRTAEEQASALAQLDMMMAEWPWNLLGYNTATYGAGTPEDISGIPDDAISAVSGYLGLRIAPGLAKSVSPEARAALSKSYNLMVAKYGGSPPTARFAPNTPRGIGRRNYGLSPVLAPFIADVAETDDDA